MLIMKRVPGVTIRCSLRIRGCLVDGRGRCGKL